MGATEEQRAAPTATDNLMCPTDERRASRGLGKPLPTLPRVTLGSDHHASIDFIDADRSHADSGVIDSTDFDSSDIDDA